MNLPRRQFLKTTALLGGGVALGFNLSGCEQTPFPGNADAVRPNAFLQLTPAGQVVLQLHKAEMGQGVLTGMATLTAEELGLPPGELKIVHANYHPAFRDPEMRLMITAGSSSMRTSFQPVREAAAMMGAMLRQAASHQLGIHQKRLQLADGRVFFEQHSTSFAELVALMRELPLADDVSLKPASEFRYIGHLDQRLDSLDKVTGRARFGLDAVYPDALTAVLVRCPHHGGKLLEFDADAARESEGVTDVFALNGAIAVVARGYWAARQAALQVQASWDKGPLEGVSQAELDQQRRQRLDSDQRRVAEQRGRQEDFAGEEIEAYYSAPFLAHATMEPMNALAVVNDQGVEIWTGTQALDIARSAVAAATKFLPEQVIIHNQFLGGGFGRRVSPDYLVEAATLAQHVNQPVKLIWSREDDMRHDGYRPAAQVRMRARVADGRVRGMTAEVVAPSILGQFLPRVTHALAPQWLPEKLHRFIGESASQYDPAAVEGIADSHYGFGYFRTDYIEEPSPVPVGYWRSVGHSQNAFFMESFVDELAQQLELDPLQFRQSLLPADSRQQTVLQLVAEKAQWGNPPAGRFQGLALHQSFGTVVAQVAEVSVENQQIKVHRVVCAVDCGLAVNPDIVQMQIEGSIIFGLTAALKGEITFRDGAVQQSNFHNYELLRMFETPEIEIFRVPSQQPPQGIGEPGVPPIAPAVANAVFAATGKRLRTLPLRLV